MAMIITEPKDASTMKAADLTLRELLYKLFRMQENDYEDPEVQALKREILARF